MRIMTPVASEQVGRQFGAEPIIVVALNINGNFIYYGDREHERFQAKITEVSGLDNVINISMNAGHAAVTIQFIDINGELKRLFDEHDLHKKPCRVYQYFPETDFDTDKILLFEGQLASPIVYDEAQMTLTVTGLSKIEDIEVGFSPDNSLWDEIIPNEIEPQAWPMPFGTPVNYPLVQITNEPYGTLIHGFGIADIAAEYLAAARGIQQARIQYQVMTGQHKLYVSIYELERLAKEIERLQYLIQERQIHANEIQLTLSDKMTEISDRDAPTPRTGSPEDLAAQAEAEQLEQLNAIRAAALAFGFRGAWRPSALRENQIRNAQYELQDAQERYQDETQNYQQELSETQQQFSRLTQKRQQWDQMQQRRLQASAQMASAAAEEAQRLAQELAHSLLHGLGNTIQIWNGPRFPHDRSLWLKIGPALVHGRFLHKEYAHEGVSTFNVVETVHPLTCDFTGYHCTELQSERLRAFPSAEYGQYASIVNQRLITWGQENDLPSNILDPQQTNIDIRYHAMLDWLKQVSPTKAYLFQLSFQQYEQPDISGEKAGFAWIDSGSPVRIAYGNPVEFILSVVPCTLLRLAAYRTYLGQRHLTTVPPEWYSIEERDYGDGLIATVVKLKRPLDSIANAGFEGQLYATVESSIGPNVVDVIQYLIEKYLPDITCDATTFDSVKTEVDIWPVNFALLERYNILELLSTICYQACLSIWFSEGIAFLRYLPNVPDQPLDLTETNIDAESLRISYTPTEDITTKIVAAYFPSYDLDKPIRLAARYNVSKYGVTERKIDYLIYNDREAVVQSLTFWLIRTANTWKYLEFTTALDTLIFETMDAITIDLPQTLCANGPVTGIVEQVEYDSHAFKLSYRVWLPVRAGEMKTYKFAYYNIGDINDEFPEPQDWATGNGLGPPLVRQWKEPGASGQYYTVFTSSPSQIPQISQIQPAVMRQPKKPRRRYSAEPESGSGSPIFTPVDGGYGDPQFPPVVDILNPEELNTETDDASVPAVDTPETVRQLRMPEPLGPVLNLRRTLVLDESTGEQAVLASFFKSITGRKLRIRSKLAVMDDNDVEGTFEMLPVPGTEDFAAKLAYLAEDG